MLSDWKVRKRYEKAGRKEKAANSKIHPKGSSELRNGKRCCAQIFAPEATRSTWYEVDNLAPMRPFVLCPFYPCPAESGDVDAFAAERNRHLSVRALLVDPFAVVHAYSGLLPMREMVLPPWTWQAPLSRMLAWLQPYEKGGKEKEGEEAWEGGMWCFLRLWRMSGRGMRRDRILWWKGFCCLWEGRRLLLKVGW
ncbi:hypothetical protein B0H67DRAFT_196284 [Lasiosphaeris hirsuta]|uniref:Uncharacterized protein n=1 Tax=Lasiosphaeris hirsuta TaxID=260670 RepID=A0AA40ARD4_9PEZI|nr:hypothetical protein B0H67DRAFT_196284 [Lasiosphaeris hirsuta]